MYDVAINPLQLLLNSVMYSLNEKQDNFRHLVESVVGLLRPPKYFQVHVSNCKCVCLLLKGSIICFTCVNWVDNDQLIYFKGNATTSKLLP